MATTYYENIQKLYVAYFNRPADPDGLAYWETVVEAAKGDTAAVSAQFAKEAEYKTAYAGMTNAQIVNQVYLNLFGRAAEDDGKAYWADLLDKKAITIDNVVAQIADGAKTTDKDAYSYKVKFAQAFTAAIDTPEEKAGYKGDAALAAAKALVSGVKDIASLAAAIAPDTLNKSVADVVKVGTPFSVLGAVKALQAAQTAEFNFKDAFDGKVDGKVSATFTTDLTDAIDDAENDLVNAMINNGGSFSGSSANVKAALIADEMKTNADDLAAAQKALTTATANMAKVDGLASAYASLTAATAAYDAAVKVQTTAVADQVGKSAAYTSLNGGAPLAIAATGTITGLIKLSSGKLVLETNVTEKDFPGVTALLTAVTARVAADKTVTATNDAKTAAQLNVDHIDVLSTNAVAETALLTTVKGLMVDYTFSGSAMPNEAQIAAQASVLDARKTAANKAWTDAGSPTATAPATPGALEQAKIDTAAKVTAFKTAVDAYHASAAASNPLATAMDNANADVKAINTVISDMAEALAAWNKASADGVKFDALHQAVLDATDVFTTNKMSLVNMNASFAVGTPDADIFVMGKTNITVSLFDTHGKDQLFIGSGFKLNTGALSTGDDTALEVFVKQSGTDTVLSVETSKFGSHAATPEVVTVTLVGVNAADIKLDSNGIITVGTPTA